MQIEYRKLDGHTLYSIQKNKSRNKIDGNHNYLTLNQLLNAVLTEAQIKLLKQCCFYLCNISIKIKRSIVYGSNIRRNFIFVYFTAKDPESIQKKLGCLQKMKTSKTAVSHLIRCKRRARVVFSESWDQDFSSVRSVSKLKNFHFLC